MFIDEEYARCWQERVLSLKVKEEQKDNKARAAEFYRIGNEYRRKGDWHLAINHYLEAIALDPESPAVEAKQMLDDILNFYHKDAYNP